MTRYIKSIALTVMETQISNVLLGLEAYGPDVGLLVPAVAVYENRVPHAILPSSDDNFTETHVCAR